MLTTIDDNSLIRTIVIHATVSGDVCKSCSGTRDYGDPVSHVPVAYSILKIMRPPAQQHRLAYAAGAADSGLESAT